MDIELLSIRSKGNLCYLEEERDFPFQIKRMYYIHSEETGEHRGFHAHKTLKQVLVCVYGEVCVLLDNGYDKAEVLLDNPSKGLLLSEMIWREMIWMKDNSVLCVLASDYYNEMDYIRDYNEFLRRCLCK